MQTETKFKMSILGPKDNCTGLALQLFAHTMGPALDSTRRSIYFDDCVEFFVVHTPNIKRKIVAAEFEKMERYKGILMPSREDALNFTKAFPDVLLTIEINSKEDEQCKSFKAGKELSNKIDAEVLLDQLMEEWGGKKEG